MRRFKTGQGFVPLVVNKFVKERKLIYEAQKEENLVSLRITQS